MRHQWVGSKALVEISFPSRSSNAQRASVASPNGVSHHPTRYSTAPWALLRRTSGRNLTFGSHQLGSAESARIVDCVPSAVIGGFRRECPLGAQSGPQSQAQHQSRRADTRPSPQRSRISRRGGEQPFASSRANQRICALSWQRHCDHRRDGTKLRMVPTT